MARPPTPTALKVLTGAAKVNPERLNRDEPQMTLGASPPSWLPKRGIARQTWDRLAPLLERIRVITEGDADALALGCLALAEYLDARTDTEHWHRADAAWKRYGNMLSWFGLTPSSRTRIHALAPKSLDPLEEWEKAR